MYNSMQYTLEVCVDSLESAITAVESGSDRIELCSSLETGGITPSYALIQHVCRRINTKCKIHVLVRPRAGDFVYSEDEIEIITADVIAIKNLGGAHGIVAGFLQPDGTIDTNLTSKFVDLCTALNLDFTFHRAFDVVKDQHAALNALIDCGVKRVLTSGGKRKCFHALDELSSLVKQAEGRISIMPGGGVDEDNAATIVTVTGATEIHGSFSVCKPSTMEFLHPKVHFSFSSRNSKARGVSVIRSTRVKNVEEGDEVEESELEEAIEYSKEELIEFWGRRVVSEEKIKKVKAELLVLSSVIDEEEQQME